jgi:hypothetical protein
VRRILPSLLAVSLTAAPAFAQLTLAAKDRVAAFKAAGFSPSGGRWHRCGDPGTPSYESGVVERVTDLNSDKLPEAVITEGSTYCFGMTGTGFVIVSKQRNGTWSRIADGPGMVHVLATKGTAGWADIEVGGPGFCFPVLRWNGKAYVVHRHQYEGKPCRGR